MESESEHRQAHGLKVLRLLSPEQAQRSNIPTESPVFVSPYITTRMNCAQCGCTATPLVYQVGYTTESQHMHSSVGGLYYLTRHPAQQELAIGIFGPPTARFP